MERIKAVFVPAGLGGPDAELHESAFVMNSCSFLTPVDEQHNRYHWFQMRNVLADDPQASLDRPRAAAGVA